MRMASLIEEVPTAEVRDGVVLNVDGSLAKVLAVVPFAATTGGMDRLSALCDQVGELVRALPDGFGLQLTVDARDERPASVGYFLNGPEQPKNAADTLRADVAAHTAQRRFRRVETWLSVCHPFAFQNAYRGGLKKYPPIRPDTWQAALAKLNETAHDVLGRLRSNGLAVEEATDAQIVDFCTRHLNPGRPLAPPTSAPGGDAGAELAPGLPDLGCTLREVLTSTSMSMPTPDTLVAGRQHVRVLCLKELPTVATRAGMLAPLFFEIAAPYRLTIYCEKIPTLLARGALKTRRSLAASLRGTLKRNIEADVQHDEIEHVIEELARGSAALCAVQIHLAVLGTSEADTMQRATMAEHAFSRASGMVAFAEDYNHLRAYLSMLPGASHRHRRLKTVTDANAAHLLTPLGAWSGRKRGTLLFNTRSGDAVPFDPFDNSLNAFNGLLFGPMGAGKTFFANQMVCNHIGSGHTAIAIDIGGGYRRLTEIFGGRYIDVGNVNSVGLNPFISPAELAALPENRREAQLQFLGTFLEQLLVEDDTQAMPTSERSLVHKGLAAFYARGSTSTHVPTLRDVQAFFTEFGALERESALRLARRLDLWIAGPRARLFEKPIGLSLDVPMIAIDLKEVGDDSRLMSIALSVLSHVIWSKLQLGSLVRTKIIFDECWKVMKSRAGVDLMQALAKTTRKYNAGMWALSQSLDDFDKSPIRAALIENCTNRVVLRHESDHEHIARTFDLHATELAAIKSLRMVKGQYSEAFIKTGDWSELVQVVPSPLTYWMSTTRAEDLALEHAYRQKNPGVPLHKLLQKLAERFPRGAQ